MDLNRKKEVADPQLKQTKKRKRKDVGLDKSNIEPTKEDVKMSVRDVSPEFKNGGISIVKSSISKYEDQ